MLLTPRRTLVQALIVSLLIHVVILLRVVGLSPVRFDAPATAINVVVLQEKRGEPSKPVSVPAAKPPAEPVKLAAPLMRNTAEQQIVVAESTSSVAPVAPPAQPEAREASAPAPALSGAVAGGGASTSVATPAPAREGVSAEDLRSYRVSLATTARHLNAGRYPKLAKERGWEGTVEMAVWGSPLLPRPEVELVHSSGRRVLDEHAIEVMTQAARVTALPESLKGRDFREPMKWEFELKDLQ